MNIYYDKKSKDIKMYSKNAIDAKDFDYIQQNLTDQQIIDLGDSNNKRQVINGTIVITKPDDDYAILLNQINLANGVEGIQSILVSIINKIFNK